jgi:hypothetical protein
LFLQQNGVGSADGELTIDVHEFDDATCRALIDFCEPYFEVRWWGLPVLPMT